MKGKTHMSRSFGPNRGTSSAAAGILAVAMAMLLLLSFAPRANASFSVGRCAGEDIQANGASFANTAHVWFKEQFKDFYCASTPFAGALAPVLTYTGDGSGAGRRAMMDRDNPSRFAGSDEPPSVEDIQKMNTGVKSTGNPAADPDPSDNGQIHVVPAAIGVIAPLVNFPTGCDVEDLDAASRTAEEFDGGSNPEDVVRVRFTREEFAGVWFGAAGSKNWDDVFPELASPTCTDVPIVRVVRFDDSGSTYALKDYLDAVDPGKGWGTTYRSGANDTREWPNATFGPRADCSNNPGPGTNPADQLTSSCSSGGGALADKVNTTDGSIGYADLATARGRAFTITPKTDDNDKYWTQLPDGGPAGGTFREPTAEPKGFRSDVTQKGANCAGATFRNGTGGAPLPSTLGGWANVTGVNSATAFATCTLTYGLVFDDPADVWGNSPVEEAKARTIKDYWENVVSSSVQVGLLGRDYAPLPDEILTIARAGVASIDWNKGSGSTENPPSTGGGNNNPPTGNNQPPTVVPPSNAFAVTKKAISSKNGKATISLKLPGPGKVVMTGKAKDGKKSINVGKVTLNAAKAGTFNLTLNPSGAAKKVLKSKGSLKVNLEITFTPTGGSAKASKSAVTLKLK
jgi:ABC-type phosphate transport system substrate-binding protein